MSCILKINDSILSSLLGKSEFKTVDELRDSFYELVLKNSVIPMNIQSKGEDFTRRKFGKVYEEDGKIKAQIVLPGQEYFDSLQLGSKELPTEARDYPYYGTITPDGNFYKVLEFNSLDTFLSFYLANFLFLKDNNYKALMTNLEETVKNVIKRFEKGSKYKHAGAIEDIRFAQSLIEYTKILYQQANTTYPASLNTLYDIIQEKVKLFHKEQLEESQVDYEPVKQDKQDKQPVPFTPTNLFFQAYDVVNGELVNKPLAQARRKTIDYLAENPGEYQIQLVEGNGGFAQQSDDNGNYPTIEQIENGVVGMLVQGNAIVYLGKDGLTLDESEAISVPYEIDGKKMESAVITFPFSNTHKTLKDQFRNDPDKSKYVYNISNTKKQTEFSRHGSLKDLGLGVEDIQINILANQPDSGKTYVFKDGRKILIDATTLKPEEIEEVIKLLEFKFKNPKQLSDTVTYLNNLISNSDTKRDKESTGREITFWEDEGRIKVVPRRIKEGDQFITVDSPKILIEENPELVRKSLDATRVRFRKGEGSNLNLTWTKFFIENGKLKSEVVQPEQGKEFYESHIKQVQVEKIQSSQIAVVPNPIPTKDAAFNMMLGLLKVQPNVEYTLGQINQLVFVPLTAQNNTQNEFLRNVWEYIFNKASGVKFIFKPFEDDRPAYYDPQTNTIFLSTTELVKYKTINPKVLLEELLHAVTIPKLESQKDTKEYRVIKENYDKAKELQKTYKESEFYQKLGQLEKESFDKVVDYYLQNIEEFVVGINQPNFRKFLMLGEGFEDASVWNSFIESVKKLLNKILKSLVPSLYTKQVTDLFNFIGSQGTVESKEPIQGIQNIEIGSQGTIINIEIKGDTGKEFLLTKGRNESKYTLWAEKQPDGSYKTSTEFPTEKQVQNLVDKYIPKETQYIINEWQRLQNLPGAFEEDSEWIKYEKTVVIPHFTSLNDKLYVPSIIEPPSQVQRNERKERPKREAQIKPKFSALPDQVDMRVVKGLDGEIGSMLFDQGYFGDFVLGNLYVSDVWNTYYNYLLEQDEQGVDPERQGWINYFFDNEDRIREEWLNKSKLYTFSDGKILMDEEVELSEEEQAENPQEEQGKDPGFNKVDSEQKYSRLQLADKYAKILVKLTPIGFKDGLTELVDFTSYWNKVQNVLRNTLSLDEQLDRLNVPEFKTLYDRLVSLPDNISSQIIRSSFQISMSTAEVPVYNSYFERIEDSDGNLKYFKYAFFPSDRLDIQNLEVSINADFRKGATQFETKTTFPTYDNMKLVEFLSKGDMVENWKALGFPIPNDEQFIRKADLLNFNNYVINLLKQRAGNSYISNGDFLGYLKKSVSWEQDKKFIESPGVTTALARVLNELSKTSEVTVSNMTRNAEGENQSLLLSWSSWLINLKKLNERTSFREKNPIFKYSILNRIVNSSNPIVPINISGSRYYDGNSYEGTISMNLDYISYLRQEISNYMLRGIGEINRSETKNSTFGYSVKWGDKQNHPIDLNNFKTDTWKWDMGSIFLDYFRGEKERIQAEIDNPQVYYPNYESIKDQFHLFRFLSNDLKEGNIEEEGFQEKFIGEMETYFKDKVDEFKRDVYSQTGIKLDRNHPALNTVQVQKKIDDLGFDNFLKAYLVNRTIYEIEHFIINEGELGQHDKPYKRFGSNISTGVPVVIDSKLKKTLDDTLDRTYTGRVPTGKTFVINDDIYQYDVTDMENEVYQSLKDWYVKMGINKSDKEVRSIAKSKVEPYTKTNVADGQGFMSPDFGRMLMMATGTWNLEREEGYWFMVIQHKKDKGIPLDAKEQAHYDYVNIKVKEKGIYWMFPSLKMQYRGPFYGSGNVMIEGLDKFSLAWLWPSETVGTKFEPVLSKMFEEGYDYGKFESGTKIGTFTPDNILEQIKSGEITITSGHDIDLTYMKEQVRAADKFKNQMPMSTQARKLILSNLKKDNEYLSEQLGQAAKEWKDSQSKLSESNKQQLMDEISTDGQVDRYKLVEKIREELKKRELPQSIKDLFENYEGQDFEESLSPQIVDTLVFSLLKNNVVKPKFLGEHYIQVASPLFDRSERDLDFYKIEDGISNSDKIIFGHPGIGKSFLKEKGLDFISLDDDYKKEINDFIDSKRGSQSRQEFKATNKKEYHEFLKNLWKIAKERAKKENKRLFVSNLPILRMFPNDFNKFITMSKETFIQRSKDRNDYKEGYTEEWKESIDKLLSEVDQSKILKTTKYLSELFSQRTTPAECKISLSGDFKQLLFIPEVTQNLSKVPAYKTGSSFEKLEIRRYILNELLLLPEFKEKYKNEITVFASRIPGQGYNSMDIFTIKEFLAPWNGPTIVLNPLATTKSGTDYDFDKLPTIVPELEKGHWQPTEGNQMIQAAAKILLDPLNFNRLVTPNTTKDIDSVVKNTLEKLGEDVSEPKFDNVFNLVSHLRKWWATKMKDALGIGATNNTFYTLAQEAGLQLGNKLHVGDGVYIEVKIPFKREGTFIDPMVGDKDKLEWVNQFINITVDIAGNDKIGYTNLRRDNSALVLFLLESGVSFEDAFYFINQPAIIKYHQVLNYYIDQGKSTGEAKREAISDLLGIEIMSKGFPRKTYKIYQDLNNLVKKDQFTDLLDSIVPKDQVPFVLNKNQKEYLAFYLIGIEMANKMREVQSYVNFDTTVSPNFLYSLYRESIKKDIELSGLFSNYESIHDDSVISHLNVHDEYSKISQEIFKIKRDTPFVEEAIRLAKMIYNQNDLIKFFRTFDNDYLLAILQNFGTINKERVQDLLKGNLMKEWEKIKPQIKDLTVSKYFVENYSTKTDIISPSIFLGLDNDPDTMDQIANDIRYMLTQPKLRQFATDLIEVGMYSVLFNQSPVYYLKLLPNEVVSSYLRDAYSKYSEHPNQEQFVQAFSKRFRYQRGMNFSQYFLTEYKKDGYKNIRGRTKKVLFNQEAWRYADYELEQLSLTTSETEEQKIEKQLSNFIYSEDVQGQDESKYVSPIQEEIEFYYTSMPHSIVNTQFINLPVNERIKIVEQQIRSTKGELKELYKKFLIVLNKRKKEISDYKLSLEELRSDTTEMNQPVQEPKQLDLFEEDKSCDSDIPF